MPSRMSKIHCGRYRVKAASRYGRSATASDGRFAGWPGGVSIRPSVTGERPGVAGESARTSRSADVSRHRPVAVPKLLRDCTGVAWCPDIACASGKVLTAVAVGRPRPARRAPRGLAAVCPTYLGGLLCRRRDGWRVSAGDCHPSRRCLRSIAPGRPRRTAVVWNGSAPRSAYRGRLARLGGPVRRPGRAPDESLYRGQTGCIHRLPSRASRLGYILFESLANP